MLLTCPECALPVSDKAVVCPHCGFPLKPDKAPKPRKNNRRKRLPNGFGQISELKGRNLRKPFRAMMTVGKTPEGKPICKLLEPIAYFETYNDAYAALLEAHKTPYSAEKDITMRELYEKWHKEHFKTNTNSNWGRSMDASWAFCGAIYDMKVKDVRTWHIKDTIENNKKERSGTISHASSGGMIRIKTMFGMMFDYAVEHEYTDKNYARLFHLPKEVAREEEDSRAEHIEYSEEEMAKIWEVSNTEPMAKMILIQCYSGWRPKELYTLKLENLNLENWSITGGLKTDSGKNRVVPVHSKIQGFIKYFYDFAIMNDQEYLFTTISPQGERCQFSYHSYQKRYIRLIEKLGLNMKHRPHDGRVQFVTMAKKCHVDEYAIKRIIGHKIDDLTEKVYTKRDLAWLREEIEKIK